MMHRVFCFLTFRSLSLPRLRAPCELLASIFFTPAYPLLFAHQAFRVDREVKGIGETP